MKVILADVAPKELPKPDVDKHFAELMNLVETLGGMTVVKVIQKRGKPSGKTYIGTGKAEEIGIDAQKLKADAVVINGILKGNQFYELTQRISVMVMDRVDVILRIFEKHAKTSEAKLQIKRARLEHDIPKIYRYAATTLFERERGGGVVQRGSGETGIEMEKRHILKQIKEIDEKLKKIQKVKQNQRKRRKRKNLKTISIVGYTNAGKSTLLKALTKKDVYIADELFATLDTRIGDLYLPNLEQKILLADTIGFIDNLPPALIASFKATLEEAQEADLLLHVYDASDTLEDQTRKFNTVQQILADLGCEETPQILVANKIDLISIEDRKALSNYAEVIPVSAYKKKNLNQLIKAMEDFLENL